MCVFVVGDGVGYLFLLSKFMQVNMALSAMLIVLVKEGKCDFLHELIIKQVPRSTAFT